MKDRWEYLTRYDSLILKQDFEVLNQMFDNFDLFSRLIFSCLHERFMNRIRYYLNSMDYNSIVAEIDDYPTALIKIYWDGTASVTIGTVVIESNKKGI